MEREEIKSQIQEVFRTTFNAPDLEICEDMTAADVSEWDSLTHIHLIIAVEDHFTTRLSNAEVARLSCVGDLINLVQNKKHASV